MKIVNKYLFLLICLCAVAPAFAQANHKLLLRDEGKSQLSYEDTNNPSASWYQPVPAGRDMQLVGNGRVLIGTGNGYEEREIATGNKVSELTAFPGTQTAHRLKNGNTLLAGANWQGKDGITLVEVDSKGAVKQTYTYPGFTYVRLVRQIPNGNFLVTADDIVFEGTAKGEIVWKATVAYRSKPHTWQAQRLENGQTLVSSGYAGNFQVFDKEGKPVSIITGPPETHSSFFSGFQVLANGNYVVANWQGHGPNFGASGVQVLEFSPDGKLAWSWKQDAAKYSSLQGVLVLDGLDLDKLHVEGKNGALTAVK